MHKSFQGWMRLWASWLEDGGVVGLDKLQRSLPNQTIPWFCEYWALLWDDLYVKEHYCWSAHVCGQMQNLLTICLLVLGNRPISVSDGHWFNFSGSRCFSELGNYSNLKRTLVVAAVEAVFNVVWLLAGDLMHFHMTPSEQKQIVSFCFSVTQMSSFWNNFFFCKFWKSTPGVVFPLLCLLQSAVW